jgi:titin
VTVRGLDINNFYGIYQNTDGSSQGAGIHITGSGATGDWIYGNFLGTDPTGTQAMPNHTGVEIDAGASMNLVGTDGDGVNDASERNLLSGNEFAGVLITGQGSARNSVAGNWIGTDSSGLEALDNSLWPNFDFVLGVYFGGGVVISAGATGNRVGTDGTSADDLGERNVIAGSGQDGVEIYGSGTDGNTVAGNFIGTDVTGTRSLGIAGNGVYLGYGASSNRIGVGYQVGQAI